MIYDIWYIAVQLFGVKTKNWPNKEDYRERSMERLSYQINIFVLLQQVQQVWILLSNFLDQIQPVNRKCNTVHTNT